MHLTSPRRTTLVAAIAVSFVAATAALGTVEAASANLPTSQAASHSSGGASKTTPIKVR
jgi:hypothetical protein